MQGFRLKPSAPELWEILHDGKHIGELQCSWAQGYEARFDDESNTKQLTDFWHWLRNLQDPDVSNNRFKWL